MSWGGAVVDWNFSEKELFLFVTMLLARDPWMVQDRKVDTNASLIINCLTDRKAWY